MDQNTKDVMMLLIPAAGAAITAWVALAQARIRATVDKVSTDIVSVSTDVKRVEVLANGHSQQLMEAKEAAARGAGMQQERQEQRGREAIATVAVAAAQLEITEPSEHTPPKKQAPDKASP